MNLSSGRPILFFDSGIGGVPYLSHLRKEIKGEKFIYIADSKNFPYGNKNSDDLVEIITTLMKSLVKKFNPKIIIVACNTASVTALSSIRGILNIPIVGVVPAVKTAAESKSQKIGILATNRTVQGEYLESLINDFSMGKEVIGLGASGIVNFVENNYFNSSWEDSVKFIKESVTEFNSKKVDSIVLGCTHFIHVEREIREAFNNRVEIIDSREGVTRQILRVLKDNIDESSKPYVDFYLTESIDNVDNYQFLCDREDISFKGVVALD